MHFDPFENSYDPRDHSATPREIRAGWWVAAAVIGLGWLVLTIV